MISIIVVGFLVQASIIYGLSNMTEFIFASVGCSGIPHTSQVDYMDMMRGAIEGYPWNLVPTGATLFASRCVDDSRAQRRVLMFPAKDPKAPQAPSNPPLRRPVLRVLPSSWGDLRCSMWRRRSGPVMKFQLPLCLTGHWSASDLSRRAK